MKKQLLLFVMMLLPMVASVKVSAVEVEIDGLWYEVVVKVKEAKVIQYKNDVKYNGEIVIPETVVYEGETISVTSIGDYAFYLCYNMTSVTIPNSVTSIGNYAFYHCSGLTSVTIGNSVTSIGTYAFQNCARLTSITIPHCVTSIGKSAFSDCYGLKKVIINDIAAWCGISFSDNYSNPLTYARLYSDENTEITELIIPNSVTRIGSYAFRNCSGLTSVTIPNSVTSIGGYAFYGCYGLTSVTIPNSVTSIGYAVFQNCSGLISVTIPNSVTSIGGSAFGGCSGLTSVTIGNSVTSIGKEAFQYCSGLTSVNIPNSVTSIDERAFQNCSGLTSVTIGNGVTSIGTDAFQNCSGLTSVTIGNGVTSIGTDAFQNCSGLKKVIVNDIAAWCGIKFWNTYSNPLYYAHQLYSDENTEITKLIIPNSVTSIGIYAFQYCSDLTSVVIDGGVKTISSLSFANCPELTDVTCYAENVPSTQRNAFEGSYIEYATLHVPTSSINAYKTTVPWSGFKTFIGLDGTLPEVKKCATPTITIADGKLTFSCETEGVTFKVSYNYVGANEEMESDELVLAGTTTAHVNVYATKEGYQDSETATADVELCIGKKGDTNQDGKVTISDAVGVVNIILNEE